MFGANPKNRVYGACRVQFDDFFSSKLRELIVDQVPCVRPFDGYLIAVHLPRRQ